MGIIFQWGLDVLVYFCALIQNMILIFYENELLTIKISKYSLIFLVCMPNDMEKWVFSTVVTSFLKRIHAVFLHHMTNKMT
jgi:hypothetical protein